MRKDLILCESHIFHDEGELGAFFFLLEKVMGSEWFLPGFDKEMLRMQCFLGIHLQSLCICLCHCLWMKGMNFPYREWQSIDNSSQCLDFSSLGHFFALLELHFQTTSMVLLVAPAFFPAFGMTYDWPPCIALWNGTHALGNC